MKKYSFLTIILLALIFLTSLESVEAQHRRKFHRRRNTGTEFMHGIGGSYMLLSTSNSTLGLPAFTYYPRVNFGKSSDFSLSLSLPISLALSLNQQSDPYSNNRSSTFALELPLSLDVNFGHGATSASRQNFGGFLGVGYGYNSMKAAESGGLLPGETEGEITGFYLNGGLRFVIRDQSVGLAAYSILASSEAHLYGLRAFWSF